MPENIRMSLQNALVIVGVIFSVGISYSAISGRISANEDLDLAQGIDIKENEDDIMDVKLNQKELAAQYGEILRRLTELKYEFREWEPINKNGEG